jgi:hypothetical protein
MLVVEDGSGLPGANAYADIPWVEGYLVGEQAQAFAALTEPEKEAAIITATRYIDAVYSWKGMRKSLEQGLSWPRVDVELEGFAITGTPAALMRAVGEAVPLLLDNAGGLFSADNDRVVISEKVDTLAVTYATSKDGGKTAVTKFQVLDSVLRGLYRLDAAANAGATVGSARVIRV